MSKQISSNLKECSFIVCKKPLSADKGKQGKEPLTDFKGDDWNEKLISYDEANKMLQEGYNIGLVAKDNIIIIDCDELELAQAVLGILPKTYQEASISGGMHFVYQCFDKIDNQSVKWNNRHLGEIRADRQYVVISPSKAFNKKGKLAEYQILNDSPLAIITKEEIDRLVNQFNDTDTIERKVSVKLSNEVLEQINKDDELKRLFNGDITGLASRSEAEQKLVCMLVSRGFDKETIFSIMANSKTDKWNEKPISYRNLTYDKAVALVTEEKKGWTDGKKIKGTLDIWTLKDFKSNVKKQKPIIENLFQTDELGMLYGDSGVRKSLLISYLAICISHGKPVFNKYRTKKQPVLILSAENGNLTTKIHFDTLMKGLRLRISKDTCNNLKIIRREACDSLLDKDFLDKVIEHLADTNTKVLFLDTLGVLVPEKDLSKAVDSIYVLKKVFSYMKSKVSDLSIYFLEHTDKNRNSYMGSIKQKGNLDVQFRIERETPDDLTCKTLVIYNEKGRLGEEGVLKIEVSNFGKPHKLTSKIKDTTQFNFISKSEAKIYEKSDSVRLNKNDKKILELLKAHALERKEILESMDCSKPTTDRRLRTMVKHGIIKSEDGVYSLK